MNICINIDAFKCNVYIFIKESSLNIECVRYIGFHLFSFFQKYQNYHFANEVMIMYYLSPVMLGLVHTYFNSTITTRKILSCTIIIF